MRSFLAGLLILLFSTAGFAQVTGFVESIGYQNYYRPDCWTPMLVNLTSQVSDPMSYQIQVWQEDLDRDQVVYTKDITLSGHTQDKFELYFIPRPTDGGLPAQPGDALHVRLCLPPKEGQRPEDAKVIIDRLPVRFPVQNLDPERNAFMGKQTGTKLVLVISDSGDVPGHSEYDAAIGLTENVAFVHVPIQELGENVLYYDGVDAVLWFSGDAGNLDRSGAKRKEALEQYIRQGGKLVVCQPVELGRISDLASMLPIELRDPNGAWLVDMAERPAFDIHLDALPQLAHPRDFVASAAEWAKIKGPFKVARPKVLKADAVVDVWDQQDLDDREHINPNRAPYIVRHPLGQGAVTWVAQDFSNRNLANATRWPNVWDRVFGWKNDTHTIYDKDDQVKRKYGDAANAIVEPAIDVGYTLVHGMDFQGKGAAYIFVAILFFIAYWIAAGPGTYLYLSGKKHKEWNWFIFGLWAFAATALTIGVVRLLLRGAPEVRHQTIVRISPNEPAYVHSRIGLYIPQDGYQTVELKDNSKDRISFITPYPVFPSYQSPSDFPAAQDYSIPVHDDPQPVKVRIPYRSTLKKLQARWVGDLNVGISGAARLVPPGAQEKGKKRGYIVGTLTNQTGIDLRSVYFVFHHLSGITSPDAQDQILFIPEWKKNSTIDLESEYSVASTLGIGGTSIGSTGNLRGELKEWASEWYRSYPSGNWTGDEKRGDDYDQSPRKSFPIMSLIDRLPPDQTTKDVHNRIDILRRGGHDLNVSGAVGAGELVVLAEAKQRDQPLPFPFEVNGYKVAGEGVVLYQFILPLDRTDMIKAMEPAAQTEPSTQPKKQQG